MTKRINKILWNGTEVPKASTQADGLDGLNLGELFIKNDPEEPGVYTRTTDGKVVLLGGGIDKYLHRLFVAIDANGREIAPNDLTTPIASVRVNYGLWTEQFLSAKGMNPDAGSGGGGGGATKLGGLINVTPDADLTHDVAKMLVLEAKSNLWTLKNLSDLVGGLDESELAAYLTNNNYAKKSDIPSLSGYATEQWVLGKGYATTSDLDDRIDALVNGAPQAYDTLKEIADVLGKNVDSVADILDALGTKADKATTLSGYGITDAYTIAQIDSIVNGLSGNISTLQGYFTDGVANSALKLSDNGSYTAWGQTFFTKGKPKSLSGALTDVTDITSSGTITTNKIVIGNGTIEWDEANKGFKVTGLYSTTYLSAKGANSSGGSSGGGGLIQSLFRYADLGKTFADTNNDTFNAYTINKINTDLGSRISVLEGKATNVSFTQSLTSGTQIGTITIDGASKNIYAPTIPTLAAVATSGKYSDLSGTPTIPTSLKSPYALTFGTKSYDGSAAKTITASDLGALTAHQSIYALTIKNSAGTTQLTYTPNSAVGELTLTKAMVGLGNVENTKLSTWVGTNKITTLGTITTGVWNGTKIANGYLANNSLTIAGNTVALGGTLATATLQSLLGLGARAYDSTEYLPKSGGTRVGTTAQSLGIDSTSSSNYIGIGFYNNGTRICGIAANKNNNCLYRYNHNFSDSYKLWDSNNDGADSGLDADLLDGKHLADVLASNVASATKLQTARTIWGQSFDGTNDVNGVLTINSGGRIVAKDGNNYNRDVIELSTDNKLYIGYGAAGAGGDTHLYGANIIFRYGTSRTEGMRLASSGNVGIGTTNPSYKLDVNGTLRVSGAAMGLGGAIDFQFTDEINRYGGTLFIQHRGDGSQTGTGSGATGNVVMCYNGGNVGIGNNNPSYKLDVNGTLHASGEVSFDSILAVGGATRIDGNVAIGNGSDGNKLYVYGVVRSAAYNAIGNNNAAFVFDKPGSNYTGIGANGVADTIYFGACSVTGAWITDYLQKWHFNGEVYAKTGVWSDGYVSAKGQNTSSDVRLKNILNVVVLNVRDIANAPSIRFAWKNGGGIDVGSSAQYWQGLLPDAVKEREGRLEMQYANIALLSAIALAKRSESHEERIARLERENKELKQRIVILEGGSYA